MKDSVVIGLFGSLFSFADRMHEAICQNGILEDLSRLFNTTI